jgi:hypothetical protein
MHLKSIRRVSILATLSTLLPLGVFAQDNKNPKDDPDQIGNRDVGKGVTSIRSKRKSR